METSRDDFIIAIRSAFLQKGAQQRLSLLSLIFFSIIVIISSSLNFKPINYIKIFINEIAYRASFIATIPENFVKNSFNNISDHFEYYDKYVMTQNELQKLKNSDLSKKIIKYENIELKRLIDDYFIEDGQIFAKVLADKKSPFLKSIIINKGSKNNIKMGMIVQDENHLVGRVVEVNYLTSRVLLISDINSKVPVTIQPLNIQSIMSGFEGKKGKLQYIRNEELINNKNQELIVVTSGSGGIFKSGISIGKINSVDNTKAEEILVDFYRDFSQLKYVKILSYKKEGINLLKINKNLFEPSNKVTLNVSNQEQDIKILQKQNLIFKEIRNKLDEENSILKEQLIDTQKQLEEQKKKALNAQVQEKDIEFLRLNLIYSHKCRKTFFKSKLYEVGSSMYRTCVLNKGVMKKN